MKILALFLVPLFTVQAAYGADLPADRVVAKLEKIHIPSVNLRDDKPEEAIDWLAQGIIGDDPVPDSTRKGISFLRAGRDTEVGKVTLSARNPTALSVLKEIAKQGGLDVYVTSEGIVYTAAGTPPFPNPKAKQGEILATIYKSKAKP